MVSRAEGLVMAARPATETEGGWVRRGGRGDGTGDRAWTQLGERRLHGENGGSSLAISRAGV